MACLVYFRHSKMSAKETIQGMTKELRTLLLNAKKELKIKEESLKKTKHIHEMTKKEYQTLYNEHVKVKKKPQQYEEYYRSQQIEKRRKERNNIEKEKKELECRKKEDFSMLDEIKKL